MTLTQIKTEQGSGSPLYLIEMAKNKFLLTSLPSRNAYYKVGWDLK